jgi:hypothetical protein
LPTQFCTTKLAKRNAPDRKKKSTADTSYCNQLTLIPSTLYSDLVLEPQPKVSIVPSPLRSGRWVIRIKHEDLTWDLVPSLYRAEAIGLLKVFSQAKVSFALNQSEGYPVQAEQIHRITERFIDHQHLNRVKTVLPEHLDRLIDEPFSPDRSLQIDRWLGYLAVEGVE